MSPNRLLRTIALWACLSVISPSPALSAGTPSDKPLTDGQVTSARKIQATTSLPKRKSPLLNCFKVKSDKLSQKELSFLGKLEDMCGSFTNYHLDDIKSVKNKEDLIEIWDDLKKAIEIILWIFYDEYDIMDPDVPLLRPNVLVTYEYELWMSWFPWQEEEAAKRKENITLERLKSNVTSLLFSRNKHLPERIISYVRGE